MEIIQQPMPLDYELDSQRETCQPDNSIVLRWLMEDPLIGIAVFTVGGRLVEVNECAARLWFGASRNDVVGESLVALVGEEVEMEMTDNCIAVYQSGKIGYDRKIWLGRQLVSMCHSIGANDSSCQILYLTHHVCGHVDETELATDQFLRIESAHFDLGELDVLSRRELEVLALIGAGLTQAAIASEFHLSVKTIDYHRSAIAKKLQKGSRAALIHLAQRAGLRVSDARVNRVRCKAVSKHEFVV